MLSFELEQKGQDVLLTLTHQRIAPEFRYKVLAGWHALLDILQARLEGKQIAPFMTIFQRLETEYERAK